MNGGRIRRGILCENIEGFEIKEIADLRAWRIIIIGVFLGIIERRGRL
jgi:hypothetical protein